jgi:hypothetical protein
MLFLPLMQEGSPGAYAMPPSLQVNNCLIKNYYMQKNFIVKGFF